jgi:Domain of unknown function (DUF4390)
MLALPMRVTRALLPLLFFLLLVPQARADPRISDFRIELDGQRVLVSLKLREAFDRRFVERVESGLPTPILYSFRLQGNRKNWFDESIRTATLDTIAQHGAVARAYTVLFKLDGELIDSRTLRDRKEVEEAMTQIQRLPVFNLDGYQSRRRLLVRVQAVLGSRTYLSFIPVTINTDWEESAKFRLPRPVP